MSRASTKPKEQIAALINADVRRRARAAFRLAQFHEDVPTFAQMVENALLREVERLEKEYNDGRTVQASTRPLTPGRPVGGTP